MVSVDPAHVAWMRQWREAAQALDADRRTRLAAITGEQALAASEAVLSLADSSPLSPTRRMTSGLVEQQKILQRQRPR